MLGFVPDALLPSAYAASVVRARVRESSLYCYIIIITMITIITTYYYYYY